MEADANIDWQTVIQDNIIADTNGVVWSAVGTPTAGQNEIISSTGLLANVILAGAFRVMENGTTVVASFSNFGHSLVGGPLNMNTNQINNVTDPTLPQDAATRAFVEATSNQLTGNNVGTGQGSVFRDKTGLFLNFKTILAGSNITVTDNADTVEISAAGAASAYRTIQDEGTPIAQQDTLNFIGTSVTAVDNAGQNRSDVTIQSYNTVQDEGGNLTQRDTINFVGAGVSAADSGGVTTVTIPGGGVQNIISQGDSNVEVIDAGTGQVDIDVDNALQARFTVAGGLAMSNDINLGTNYMDVAQITTPANPGAGVRRLFVDSGSGELSVRTNAGTTVSLEQAGGGGLNTNMDNLANPTTPNKGIDDMPYIETATANPATAGVFRLSATDALSWRNNANNLNLDLDIDANDKLVFDQKEVMIDSWGIALGDETSDATAGDDVQYAAPFKLEVTKLQAFARTAPTGQAMTVTFTNVTQAATIGVVTIAAGTQVGTQTTITTPDVATDDVIDVEITQIGTTVAGAGVKGTMIGFFDGL